MEKFKFETPKNEKEEPEKSVLGAGYRKAREFISRKLELGQSPEFNWNESMVRFREDHMKKFEDGDEMGIQADILFDGTEYEKVFDKTIKTLREFAKTGEEDAGWKFSENYQENFGKFRRVNIGERTYGIVDETREKDAKVPYASIREDFSRDEKERAHEGGNYYFYGDGKNSPRKIEICGARMDNITQVLEDIKKVLEVIESEKSKKN